MDFKAPELTARAVCWLKKEYPGALVMTEFNAAKWGGALIDVAAITKDQIIGVEIKGEGDNLARLVLQGPSYSTVASEMFLLCCPDLHESVKKSDKTPRGWTRLHVAGEGIDVDGYRWKRGPGVAISNLPNSPMALCDLLWKPELVRLAQSLGCNVVSRMRADEVALRVTDHFPLAKIRQGVIDHLRIRDWSFKNGVHITPVEITKPKQEAFILSTQETKP